MPRGTVLGGRYRLDETYATDGETAIWRGVDTELGRTVSVRLPEPRWRRFAVESFRAQFRLLSTIDHPGILRVYDVGFTPSAPPYLVTEYVKGERLLRDGPLTPDRTMDLVAQAADALQVLHDRGVVYRNVDKGLSVRGDGTAVLDRFVDARPEGAPPLWLIFTSRAALDRPATRLTDLYDLGLVAHYCLTLDRYFRAFPPDYLNDPTWPPGIPPDVRAVIEKALAIKPAERWPTAAALAEAARRARRA